MAPRGNFGRRGDNSLPPSPVVVAPRKNPSVLPITVVVVIGLGAIGWVAKKVTPDQPAAEVAAVQPVAEPVAESPPATLGKMWVTSDRLARHTCPSASCGVVGRLFFREAADVAEIEGNWGRVSKRYDASCSGGNSAYVDDGNAACVGDNGIVDGQLAEWVEIAYLSPNRPADPAEGAIGVSKLIAGSDDFRTYEAAFVNAAQKLMESGQCTEADFKEMGGFMKSTNNQGPVYFIYCGGMTAANRLYLNAATGKTYR